MTLEEHQKDPNFIGRVIIWKHPETKEVIVECMLTKDGDVWYHLPLIAELYQVSKEVIQEAIDDIFATGEQFECQCTRVVTRKVSDTETKMITQYNLKVIIALGLRIDSYIAKMFRTWGYAKLTKVMDDEELKLEDILKPPTIN